MSYVHQARVGWAVRFPACDSPVQISSGIVLGSNPVHKSLGTTSEVSVAVSAPLRIVNTSNGKAMCDEGAIQTTLWLSKRSRCLFDVRPLHRIGQTLREGEEIVESKDSAQCID
jgi:hypothetical protein